MKLRLIASCIALGLACGGKVACAQDEKFDINRFEIRGNSLLLPGQVDELVAPYVGKGKVYGDIQKALEALENAYQAKGYSTVNVSVPEQEITSGVIRLEVQEAVLGKVTITGNQHFSTENVRASLPNLREGAAPNLRQVSENVQLVNDNPAKQVEVTLGASEEEGKVEAKVSLTEQNPQRFFVTLDDTGTVETGRHRLGVAYQNANLLGNDETLTLAYTTSPDIWWNRPDGVKVDIYSVAFRKPFYSIGDSLDVIYGNSNVNTPATQATGFGIVGKGEVFALRWNHFFPRRGEYSGKLVLGYDYKHINTTCDPDQRGTTATCTPYTLQPISATYNGQIQRVSHQASYNIGLAYNLPTGKSYPINNAAVGRPKTDRYSFISNRDVNDDFLVLRFSGSYAQQVAGWTLRAALNGQLANSGLPSAEQLGLAGASAVRGFSERALAADTGHVVNLEAYTPNLASQVGASGNLHGVGFIDFGYGRNVGVDNTASFNTTGVASVGAGVRYSLQRDLSFSLDVAKVTNHGHGDDDTWYRRNGWGGHFKLLVGF